jgi:hypothetical protein
LLLTARHPGGEGHDRDPPAREEPRVLSLVVLKDDVED